MSGFDNGGVLLAGMTKVTLGVTECVVRAGDILAGRAVCCRIDDAHLTAAHPEDRPAESDAS